jgi:hypothetical protein
MDRWCHDVADELVEIIKPAGPTAVASATSQPFAIRAAIIAVAKALLGSGLLRVEP